MGLRDWLVGRRDRLPLQAVERPQPLQPVKGSGGGVVRAGRDQPAAHDGGFRYVRERAWRLPDIHESTPDTRGFMPRSHLPAHIAECPWLVAVLVQFAPWDLRRIAADGVDDTTWPAWVASAGYDVVCVGGAPRPGAPRVEVFARPSARPEASAALSLRDLVPWLPAKTPGSVRCVDEWSAVEAGHTDLAIAARANIADRFDCIASTLAAGGVLVASGVEPAWMAARGYCPLDVPDSRFPQLWSTVMRREPGHRYVLIVEPRRHG